MNLSAIGLFTYFTLKKAWPLLSLYLLLFLLCFHLKLVHPASSLLLCSCHYWTPVTCNNVGSFNCDLLLISPGIFFHIICVCGFGNSVLSWVCLVKVAKYWAWGWALPWYLKSDGSWKLWQSYVDVLKATGELNILLLQLKEGCSKLDYGKIDNNQCLLTTPVLIIKLFSFYMLFKFLLNFCK